MSAQSAKSTIITATLVPEQKRLAFLPKMLPRCFSAGEVAIYYFASLLNKSYQGAYWHYYQLSNGGFYIAPKLEGTCKVSWAGNYYSGEMSADAFGVTASLFGINYLANKTASDAVIDKYYQLRDFIKFHPEAGEIIRAID